MLLTIVKVVEDLPEPNNKDKDSNKDYDKEKVLTMLMTIAKVVEDLPVTIRTDGAKLDLLENTDWFRLPYPCQFHSPYNPVVTNTQIIFEPRWILGLCSLYSTC